MTPLSGAWSTVTMPLHGICVTQGTTPDLSEPHFLCLQNRDIHEEESFCPTTTG